MNLLLTVLLVLATAAVAAAQPSPTPPGKAFVSVNGASHVASNDFTDGADFGRTARPRSTCRLAPSSQSEHAFR
jgi:hypothetical protein